MKTSHLSAIARKLGVSDRYDATKVRDVPALERLMIHLMPKRTECEVFLPDKLDVTELVRYVEQKNQAEPQLHLTVFHCMVAALAHMVKNRPKTNRFVQGRKMYARNKIRIGFICKVKKEDNAIDSLITYEAEDADNIVSVAEKVNREISAARNCSQNKAGGNSSDALVEKLSHCPNFILRLIFGVLKTLDYTGADISFITKADINYCSVLVSNLGSVGMSSVYHHLNNYGTTSMVVTLGIIHKEEVIQPDGSKAIRDILDIGTTVDERVADGFYFAKSVHYLKEILAHPEILDEPLAT